MKTMINVSATLRYKNESYPIVASKMTAKEKLYLDIGKVIEYPGTQKSNCDDKVLFNPKLMEIRVANCKIDPYRSYMFNTWNLNLPVVCYLEV